MTSPATSDRHFSNFEKKRPKMPPPTALLCVCRLSSSSRRRNQDSDSCYIRCVSVCLICTHRYLVSNNHYQSATTTQIIHIKVRKVARSLSIVPFSKYNISGGKNRLQLTFVNLIEAKTGISEISKHWIFRGNV